MYLKIIACVPQVEILTQSHFHPDVADFFSLYYLTPLPTSIFSEPTQPFKETVPTQLPLHKKLLVSRTVVKGVTTSDLCCSYQPVKLLPEAKGRIHSLLLRSSLHRSLKAALQLL